MVYILVSGINHSLPRFFQQCQNKAFTLDMHAWNKKKMIILSLNKDLDEVKKRHFYD